MLLGQSQGICEGAAASTPVTSLAVTPTPRPRVRGKREFDESQVIEFAGHPRACGEN